MGMGTQGHSAPYRDLANPTCFAGLIRDLLCRKATAAELEALAGTRAAPSAPGRDGVWMLWNQMDVELQLPASRG